jgi:thioredoxin-related protein
MSFIVKFGLRSTLMKYLVCFWIFCATGFTSAAFAQATEDGVKWMTFEQAVESSKKEKRPVFIDVYTDWCGWCKVMDKETFNEPAVAKMLNEKYYPVKFNAEQTEDVTFAGTTFKFVPYGNKGTHQLAMALLNNQLSYPTVVFMDAALKSAFPLAGYRKPPEFHKFLTFFSEDQSQKGQTAWTDFEKTYKSPYTTPAP